jgi:gamma-glutamylcysteine synthetase
VGGALVGLQGERFGYAAEVGRGTIEVITEPCADLHELADCYDEAMARLLAAAEKAGAWVLGFGIQPKASPTLGLMTDKPRYHVLHDAIGDGWLSFALTASDQIQVDVARPEWLRLTNTANALAPLTVGLTANSSITNGAPALWCSAREGLMGTIDAAGHRHGLPAGACADAVDFVGRLAELEFLIDRPPSGVQRMEGTFSSWLERAAPDQHEAWRAYLVHEHYVWHSGRPRPINGTLELRSACQQPWAERHAAAALGLALVEGGEAIAALLETQLGDQLWPAMRSWHGDVVRDGLAAPEPVPGLLTSVLSAGADALAQRGLGEERHLEPLFARVDARANPGQRVREHCSKHGLAATLPSLRAG